MRRVVGNVSVECVSNAGQPVGMNRVSCVCVRDARGRKIEAVHDTNRCRRLDGSEAEGFHFRHFRDPVHFVCWCVWACCRVFMLHFFLLRVCTSLSGFKTHNKTVVYGIGLLAQLSVISDVSPERTNTHTYINVCTRTATQAERTHAQRQRSKWLGIAVIDTAAAAARYFLFWNCVRVPSRVV